MGYKITMLGAGNMGSVLAAKFSQKNDVCVYLNEVESQYQFKKDIEVFCEDEKKSYFGKIKKITTNIEEAIRYAEIIVITYPAFLFSKYAELIIPHLTEGQHLLFVPGSGGAELQFKKAVDKGVTISGLQRVHSVARLEERGVLVRESGIRKELNIASIPVSFNDEAAKIVSDLYSLPVTKLDNYLNVTLVNSNPILHTSRLYSIFKDYPEKIKQFDYIPLFYEEWSIETSKLLISMDCELFKLFERLGHFGLPVNQIKSLLEHYESTNEIEMTNKIRSINSLKGLKTPSIEIKNKFKPDLESRYFTADFPYGLDILLSFCEFFSINCEHLKMVSDWYRTITRSKLVFSVQGFFDSEKEFIEYYKK